MRSASSGGTATKWYGAGPRHSNNGPENSSCTGSVQHTEPRLLAWLAAYPEESEPIEPPVTADGALVRWWWATGCSEASMPAATLRWMSRMSGPAVFTSGGTREKVARGWPLAFSASPMNVSTSLAGMSVDIIAEDALAIFSKFVSTVCGLSWWSIAFITHFWRAIRE